MVSSVLLLLGILAGCSIFRGVKAHATLSQPLSRPWYAYSYGRSDVAATWPVANEEGVEWDDWEYWQDTDRSSGWGAPSGGYVGAEYCPHCHNAGGTDAVKQNGQQNLGGLSHIPYPPTDATQAGRHGICGAPLGSSLYSQPGPIGRDSVYAEGQTITVTVSVNAYHYGHTEFRVCDRPDALSQSCFNQHVLLRTANGSPGIASDRVSETDPPGLPPKQRGLVTLDGSAVDDPNETSPVHSRFPERFYFPTTSTFPISSSSREASNLTSSATAMRGRKRGGGSKKGIRSKKKGGKKKGKKKGGVGGGGKNKPSQQDDETTIDAFLKFQGRPDCSTVGVATAARRAQRGRGSNKKGKNKQPPHGGRTKCFDSAAYSRAMANIVRQKKRQNAAAAPRAISLGTNSENSRVASRTAAIRDFKSSTSETWAANSKQTPILLVTTLAAAVETAPRRTQTSRNTKVPASSGDRVREGGIDGTNGSGRGRRKLLAFTAPKDGSVGAGWNNVFTYELKLPPGLTCDHCVLQMYYHTSNSCRPLGYDTVEIRSWSAHSRNSMGHCWEGGSVSEEFWNCADIKITPGAGSPLSPESPSEPFAPSAPPVLKPSTPDIPPNPSIPPDVEAPPAPPQPSDGGGGGDCPEGTAASVSTWWGGGGTVSVTTRGAARLTVAFPPELVLPLQGPPWGAVLLEQTPHSFTFEVGQSSAGFGFNVASGLPVPDAAANAVLTLICGNGDGGGSAPGPVVPSVPSVPPVESPPVPEAPGAPSTPVPQENTSPPPTPQFPSPLAPPGGGGGGGIEGGECPEGTKAAVSTWWGGGGTVSVVTPTAIPRAGARLTVEFPPELVLPLQGPPWGAALIEQTPHSFTFELGQRSAGFGFNVASGLPVPDAAANSVLKLLCGGNDDGGRPAPGGGDEPPAPEQEPGSPRAPDAPTAPADRQPPSFPRGEPASPAAPTIPSSPMSPRGVPPSPSSPGGGCAEDRVWLGYFSNWFQWYPQPYTFLPEDIQAASLTHINFAFAMIHSETFAIRNFEDNDVSDGGYGPHAMTPCSGDRGCTPGLYERVNNLKIEHPHLKTLISIGGWGFNTPWDEDSENTQRLRRKDPGWDEYVFSNMVGTEENRGMFIASCVSFARTWGFDGIDLDWEYPGFIDRGGRATDKADFVLLLQEMRAEFESEAARTGRVPLLLTLAVGISPTVAENGYDIPQIAMQTDFINLMSYDIWGGWNSESGARIHSQLHAREGEDMYCPGGGFECAELSGSDFVEFWLAAGAPPAKLNLGFAAYGRGWMLADGGREPSQGPGAAVSGSGDAQPYTKQHGTASYYEIAALIDAGAEYTYDSERGGAYIQTAAGLWIGYDSVESAEQKAAYIIENKLRGGFIWDCPEDDFLRGSPIITGVAEALGNPADCGNDGGTQPGSGGNDRPPAPRDAPPAPTTGCDGRGDCAEFCDGKPAGLHAARDAECRGYFNCFGGAGELQLCPLGQRYNPTAMYCDWPANVPCMDQSPSIPPSSPLIPPAVPAPSSPVEPPVSPSAPPSPPAGPNVDRIMEVLAGVDPSEILISQQPDLTWAPSSVYKWSDFLAALQNMATTAVDGKTFWLGEATDSDPERSAEAEDVYGLVGIAAFLAQSMKETIRYDVCDENNWDQTTGYAASNACGQLGQSYQNYDCPANQSHMQCDVDPDMTIRASTSATWYGAPAPLFCAPKSDLPEAPKWNSGSGWCGSGGAPAADMFEADEIIEYLEYAGEEGSCRDYPGQRAGGWELCGGAGCPNTPAPNFGVPLARTDVEGCCWWGRGVIQTTGVCNVGKLNYFMGKKAADQGRAAVFPDVDFCAHPEAICDPDSPHPELKWIAGLFYWMADVQNFVDFDLGWSYQDELRLFVDSGFPDPKTDTGFIHGVSGIVNRGCPNPPACGTGNLDGGAERAKNFETILRAMGLVA